MTPEQAARVAGRLTGSTIAAVEPAGGGGNSRLLRVRDDQGRSYALKLYPPRSSDTRDRLGAETAALEFMLAWGIECTPRLLGIDRDENCVLLSWVDGVLDERGTEADVDQSLDFLGALHAARHHPDAERLNEASEACLSAAELIGQVERRLARLDEPAAGHRDLADLLGDGMRPLLGRARAQLERVYADAHRDPTVPTADWTLSPSDFGLHNTLKLSGGRRIFIDFEYFGRDDAVKLTADTMLHPRNILAPAPRERLTRGLRRLYGSDDWFFEDRLAAQLPLYGLRWCAILLNEFLPEKWAIRAHAGHQERKAAQRRQFTKALSLFETMSRTYDPTLL